MKIKDPHFYLEILRRGELICLFGFAGGRVKHYESPKEMVYSVRFFFICIKAEISWITA